MALGAGRGLMAQGRPAQLPSQAAAQAVEQFEGELEVRIEDDERTSRVHHVLRTRDAELRLEIPGDPPGLQTGDRVRVHGRRNGNTLSLDSASSVQPMALANGNTFGAQRTIVMLVNFQDNTATPYAWTHAHAVTFQTTSDFFLENSHGQTWLTGDVFGWFTLPMTSTTCDTNKISSLADQAAAAAGATLSHYTRKIYAFPRISACSWWGLGSVGGNPSRSWINGTYSLKVVAHELGHNFGDYHSRSQPCDSAGCSTVEYGDDADVMGNPTSGHLNAFQKERLGWLNYGSSPTAPTVSQGNNYWISAYATGSSSPRALKVLKAVDSYGRRTWYYVEARVRAGFDAGVNAGVILHTGSETSANSSFQIDLDPTTSSFDSRLDPGQMFTDAALGVTVKTLWTDATGAMVEILFVAAPCTAREPAVTLQPGGTVWAQPGSPVTYSMAVNNRDDVSCAASTFDLDALVPTGWSRDLSPGAVTIPAGGSTSATVTVTPPTTATGPNNVEMGAYRSGPNASVVSTVQIVTNYTVTLAVTASKAYDLRATVLAGTSPVAGAAVTFTIADPNGGTRMLTATTGSDGTAKATFRKKRTDPAGAYTAEATAVANGLSGTSSAVPFTVK